MNYNLHSGSRAHQGILSMALLLFATLRAAEERKITEVKQTNALEIQAALLKMSQSQAAPHRN